MNKSAAELSRASGKPGRGEGLLALQTLNLLTLLVDLALLLAELRLGLLLVGLVVLQRVAYRKTGSSSERAADSHRRTCVT